MSKPRINHSIRSSLFAGLVAALAALFTAGARADFDIYISSNSNNTVYQIPSTFGGVTVGAGQVFGTYTGNYGITNSGEDIYVLQNNGNIYTKNAFAGGAGSGSLFTTATGVGTALDLDVADSSNIQVVGTGGNAQVFNSSGTSLGTYALSGANGSAGIDYVPGGGVYVTFGSVPGTIEHLTGSGTAYTEDTSSGVHGKTYNNFLQQIVMGPNGDLYTASFQPASGPSEAIYEIDPASGLATDITPGGSVTVGVHPYSIRPTGVDIGPDGLLYFADVQNNFLFRSNLDGSNPQIVAEGFDFPVAITFATVPEPASLGLLVLGSAALLPRRRRR